MATAPSSLSWASSESSTALPTAPHLYRHPGHSEGSPYLLLKHNPGFTHPANLKPTYFVRVVKYNANPFNPSASIPNGSNA